MSLTKSPTKISAATSAKRDAALDQFARRLCVALDETTEDVPYDVAERLRAARVRAVEVRKHRVRAVLPRSWGHNGSATLSMHEGDEGGRHSPWWARAAFAGWLLAVLVGLFAISAVQYEVGVLELAELDTAILTDDLPPAAYVDVGFAQFLQLQHVREP
ncbi:DUF3619 family protein [Candidatus Symbiobacter mobilis]|uniref:DUF3619 family protein n=1 Tax=Candidatus Symbiobacter mobilis CR TaxID=946483 RepID=U5N453_9BURK|nr:DUF3619 family protein [Candidatus Symbiobacter mobilis]AGX86261.1 hypothetical protein Cenrod_0127 [Candidatus Symbiobacter mobilis CR]